MSTNLDFVPCMRQCVERDMHTVQHIERKQLIALLDAVEKTENGTRSESAPLVKAETVTAETRQAGGNPVGDTNLTAEVVKEMRRLLSNCGDMPNTADFFDLQALLCEHKAALLDAVEERDRLRAQLKQSAAQHIVIWNERDAAQERVSELEVALSEEQAKHDAHVVGLNHQLNAMQKRIAELKQINSEFAQQAKELSEAAQWYAESQKRVKELEAQNRDLREQIAEITTGEKGGAR